MEKLRLREILNDILKLVHSICDPAITKIGGDFFHQSHNHQIGEMQNIHNA